MSRKVRKDGPTSSDAHVNAPSADMAIRYQLGDTKEKGDTMPIQECTLPEGGKGFKYGDSGKCYANRSDAEAQAAAVHASGYVEKKFEAIKKSASDDDTALYFMDQESIAAYEYEAAVEFTECPKLQAILAEHAKDEYKHYLELSEWRRMQESQPEADESGVMKGETHTREYLDAFLKFIMANPTIGQDIKESAHKMARATAGGMISRPKSPEAQPEELEEEEMGEVDVAESYSKSYTVQICKMADNVVYGVVLAPDKADLQEDVMSKEDIEFAAHEYLKESRAINLDHKTDTTEASVVESWIAKEDGLLGERPIVKGSWIMGTELSPSLADKVRKGIYNSYSIEGTGVREKIKE